MKIIIRRTIFGGKNYYLDDGLFMTPITKQRAEKLIAENMCCSTTTRAKRNKRKQT